MKKEWLRNKSTVGELEKKYGHILNCSNMKIKSEASNWEFLKSKAEPNDELWEFITPYELWESYSGKMGISLVRDGEIIENILLKTN